MRNRLTAIGCCLITLSTFADDACDYPGFSEETLAILRMPDPDKTEALQERSIAITESIGRYANLLCAAATIANIDSFKRTIEGVKQREGGEAITGLSMGEVAYYVRCDEYHNAFYENMKMDEIKYDANGLSDTTLQLIRAMGPLLLESGPGEDVTSLEFVQAKLRIAQKHYGDTVQGVYSRLKTKIMQEVRVLNDMKDGGKVCWGR